MVESAEVLGLDSVRQSRRVCVRAAGGGRAGAERGGGVPVRHGRESVGQLPSTNPLGLTDDPWGSDPSYYWTLPSGGCFGRRSPGHVDRPGAVRDPDVVLRPGRSDGVERLPSSGYPAFTGAEQAAYTAASQLPAVQALLQPSGATEIREFWAAENPPPARVSPACRAPSRAPRAARASSRSRRRSIRGARRRPARPRSPPGNGPPWSTNCSRRPGLLSRSSTSTPS